MNVQTKLLCFSKFLYLTLNDEKSIINILMINDEQKVEPNLLFQMSMNIFELSRVFIFKYEHNS